MDVLSIIIPLSFLPQKANANHFSAELMNSEFGILATASDPRNEMGTKIILYLQSYIGRFKRAQYSRSILKYFTYTRDSLAFLTASLFTVVCPNNVIKPPFLNILIIYCIWRNILLIHIQLNEKQEVCVTASQNEINYSLPSQHFCLSTRPNVPKPLRWLSTRR